MIRAPKYSRHQNGVERHHRAAGKPEHQRETVEAREIASEHVKAHGDGLECESEDDHALCADAVGREPADDAPAQRRHARRAEHRSGSHRRHAAVDRIADHVEDRPGMCRAAGEVGERDGGEMRRAEGTRHGELAGEAGARRGAGGPENLRVMGSAR
jgi:hypothetical protein